MSNDANPEQWDRADAARLEPAERDEYVTVESYEIDDGVVFYDAENPLAWVEANAAVRLDEHA
ncbi:MAG: hypothetical protein ABEJ22_08860 [Haloferacaceae archaeon]